MMLLIQLGFTMCLGLVVSGYPMSSNDYILKALEDAKASMYHGSKLDSRFSDYGYDGNRPVSRKEATEKSWIDMEVDPFWPSNQLNLGQVAGVAVNADDDLVLVHRADHPWDPSYQLFDESNRFLARDVGPITEPVVVTVSQQDGTVMDAWGANRFYMPHGLTIDEQGNTWVTDVALHQVLKFAPGSSDLVLTLGKAFEPATDNTDAERFCKPTDVAVSKDGSTVFVADGYCNSRVVRVTSNGTVTGQLGAGELLVPHSLALAEDLDLLCVADREHHRIACYNAGLKNGASFGELERIYTDPNDATLSAIEYAPKTGLLFAVNGPTYATPGIGFTIDLHETEHMPERLDIWSPFNTGFSAPHDVTVCHGGNTLYVGEVTLAENNIWQFHNDATNLSLDAKIAQLTDFQQYMQQTDPNNMADYGYQGYSGTGYQGYQRSEYPAYEGHADGDYGYDGKSTEGEDELRYENEVWGDDDVEEALEEGNDADASEELSEDEERGEVSEESSIEEPEEEVEGSEEAERSPQEADSEEEGEEVVGQERLVDEAQEAEEEGEEESKHGGERMADSGYAAAM